MTTYQRSEVGAAAKHRTTVRRAYTRFAVRVALTFGTAFFAAEVADHTHTGRALVWAGIAAGVRAVVGLLTPVDPAVGVKSGEFKES